MGRKRIIGVLWLATAIASLVLAGCGGKESTGTAEEVAPTATEETTGTATEDATPSPTEEEQAGSNLLGPMPTEPTDLLVWTGAGGPWEDFAKQFMERYPNVKVKVQRFDFATAITKVTTAVAAREGPDVLGGPYNNPAWYKALVPLNGYLTDEMRQRIQYLPLQEAQDNGSLYYLPYESYSYVWYYNKDLFTKAGLDPEAPPTTWSELLDACDTLKAAGITPIAAGWKDGWLAGWYTDYGFSSQLITPDMIKTFYDPNIPPEDKAGWTDPLFRTAFGYLLALRDNGCFNSNAGGLSYSDMIPIFSNQEAAMMYTVAGFPPFKDTGNAIGGMENLGVFKMPRVPESPYTTQPLDAGPNTAVAITNFRPDRCRVAWEFINFLYEPEQQMYLWEGGTGGDKNYPNLLGLPPLTAGTPQEGQVLEWLQNPDNHGGFNPGPAADTDSINRIEAALMGGHMTLDEALEQLEELRLKKAELQPKVEFQESPVCG